jgi:glycosyltransferase involved in cell wall biosynthesis
VFFAAAYTAPAFCPCPFAVAIYDVSFAAHPEWFGWRDGLRRRTLSRLAARRAAKVITISEFSATEIARYFGVPARDQVIAPPGAPAARATSPEPREPIVLYVGSLFNRREIPLLIEGFAIATRTVPGARLILVGDNRTAPRIDPMAEASRAGVADRVEWRAYVSDQALDELYQTARVFAFLSRYEGFAMTPLEAIARNVPAVLLDTPVAREVYGAGAWLVAPTAEEVARALTVLLSDTEAHAVLLSRGRELLPRYSWTHAADTIQQALEAAVEGSASRS